MKLCAGNCGRQIPDDPRHTLCYPCASQINAITEVIPEVVPDKIIPPWATKLKCGSCGREFFRQDELWRHFAGCIFSLKEEEKKKQKKVKVCCGELECGISCGKPMPCKMHPKTNKVIVE